MKSLFFVSVAICIFSGTYLTATAQQLKNAVHLTDAVKNSHLPKFIDGIEIKPGRIYDVQTVKEEPLKSRQTIPANTVSEISNRTSNIEMASALQFKYAQLLDCNVEFIKNISLFNFIEDWWGTRYRYGGTTKKGIDCSALTGLLMGSVFAVKLPRTAREQYNECEKVSRDEMQEGDLVFFNTRGGVSHVGVYLGNNHFVHSSTNQGVVISSLEEPYYENRFIGGGRVLDYSSIVTVTPGS